MNKNIIVLMLSAAVFSVVPPVLGQTPSATQAATTLRVRGTIDKYDQSARVLVLTTPTGTLRFPVAPTTRIRQGWHDVAPADLPKLAGDHATVRYTESSGTKIVESVHVFPK